MVANPFRGAILQSSEGGCDKDIEDIPKRFSQENLKKPPLKRYTVGSNPTTGRNIIFV